MRRILLLSIISLATCNPALAQDVITIAQSKPFVATSDAVQRTSEFIDIPKGQDKLQMTLTYYNGSETAPGFTSLQIQSPSMNYVTQQSFDGKKSFSSDVTGDMAWGGNQIMITAKGPKGATLGWRLTTPKPEVTGVTPPTVYAGGTLTIAGTNLCPDPDDNEVTIDGKKLTCVSATSNQLVVKVPYDSPGGANQISVKSAGIEAGKLATNINVTPYLKSLSSTFVSPGCSGTIYGNGFGTSVNNVVLYMGPIRAPITAVTPTTITFNVPGAYGGEPWGINEPLKVTVNGVKARNVLFLTGYEGSIAP